MGIASIVIDRDSVFQAVGPPDTKSNYQVAIRGADRLGAGGKVFWGDTTLFKHDPELLEVTFPGGSWQLAAIPTVGWHGVNDTTMWILISGVLISLLVTTLTVTIQRDNIRIKPLALHDQLTKLPNRLQFNARVTQALAHAQRNHGQVATAVLGLNKFKPINDHHGHLVGDYVLEQVTQRILTSLHKKGHRRTNWGDKFTLLLVANHSVKDIAIGAEKLAQRLRKPFHSQGQGQGQQISVGLSIGVALFPEHGTEQATLCQYADITMYNAKHDPKAHWMFATLPAIEQSSRQSSFPL